MRLPPTHLFNAPFTRHGFLGRLRLVLGLLGLRPLVRRRRVLLVPLALLRNSLHPVSFWPVWQAEGAARGLVSLFSSSYGGSGCSGVKGRGAGKKTAGRVVSHFEGGGCLAPHWRRWQAIGAESWFVSALRDRYRVPFSDSPPPLSRTPVSFPTYRAGSSRAQALRQEVMAMLAKGALEIALDPGLGFYSRLFLVEKASRGWRPVIDLSHRNEFVQLTPFKTETVVSVLLSVRQGDFLASLDLKDAYFQIPIHPS